VTEVVVLDCWNSQQQRPTKWQWILVRTHRNWVTRTCEILPATVSKCPIARILARTPFSALKVLVTFP